MNEYLPADGADKLTVTYETDAEGYVVECVPGKDPVRVLGPGYFLPDPNAPVEPIVIDRKNTGPVRLVRERISRNGPCFCGSGQKFKRCCIRVYADVPVVRSEG